MSTKDFTIRRPARQEKVERPAFALTDLGNAERFGARHGAGWRYCPALSVSVVWDGRRWCRDEHRSRTFQLAKDVVRAIPAEADGLPDGVRRKAIRDHALRSESLPRLKAMIEAAQSEPALIVAPEDLDADPWLLNVANGTLDLRTGELRPHRREDLLTKLAPVSFDPDASCPTWDRFTLRILPDASVRSFLQRYLGYALTGETSEQVIGLLYGTGSNGKTTLVETIRIMLGDYAADLPFESLDQKIDAGVREDLARLEGRRFVTASEPEKGVKLATSILKRLSGGDAITARFLYGHFGEFAPVCKLVLSFNNRPEVKDASHGAWRRLRLIPFTETIRPEEADPHLKEKLLSEAPGILNWLIRGCLDWRSHGLTAPAAVLAATDDYRRSQDELGPFLADRCILTPTATATAKALHAGYRAWCEANHERPKSQNVFGELLREHGFLALSNGKARYWKGVGLLDQDDRDEDHGEALAAPAAAQQPAAPSEPAMPCPGCRQPSEHQGTYLTDDGRARYWCPACRTCFYAPEPTTPREQPGVTP